MAIDRNRIDYFTLPRNTSIGLILLLAVLLTSQARGAEPPAVDYYPQPSPSEVKLQEALERRVTLAFSGIPLTEALTQVESRFDGGLQFHVDRRALTDAGISVDVPVSIRVRQARLRTALSLLLAEQDLNYTPHDGLLLITTQDRIDSMTIVRVYPIGDLAPDGDVDGICALIQQVVHPTSWPAGTGPGPIQYFPAARSLVLEQTREVHQGILELLRALRAAKAAVPSTERK